MSEAKGTQEPESAKKHGDELDSLVPVAGHTQDEPEESTRKPAPVPIK